MAGNHAQGGRKADHRFQRCRKAGGPFAEKLGLAYLYRSAKPLPFALGVARRRMQVKRREMAMVGDQLYADRMAAALYGIPGLMVIPRGPDLGAQVVLKRKWEKKHWQEYYDRGGKTL